MEKAKLLQSSQNPQKYSATLKSILLAIVPVVIFVSASKGVTVAETDLLQIIEGVTGLAASAGFLFGASRKVFNLYK